MQRHRWSYIVNCQLVTMVIGTIIFFFFFIFCSSFFPINVGRRRFQLSPELWYGCVYVNDKVCTIAHALKPSPVLDCFTNGNMNN